MVCHSGCLGQDRAQEPLSAGTEPLTLQISFLLRLYPFSFRVTWGFFSCFPAVLSQPPGPGSLQVVLWSQCQTLLLVIHCLFSSGGGD